MHELRTAIEQAINDLRELRGLTTEDILSVLDRIRTEIKNQS